MWRNYGKQVLWRNHNCRRRRLLISQSSSSPRTFPGKSQPSDSPNHLKFQPFGLILDSVRNPNCKSGFGWLRNPSRWYASVAETLSPSSFLSSDIDDDEVFMEEDFREPPREVIQEEVAVKRPMGRDYAALKRRQVKLETEAWEKASNDYRQMVHDMCRQKLAPNLPYMKSLFLGWFEPLRDAIKEEQKLCVEGKCRNSYAPYFVQLPADLMAIIAMHKLMGLLMTKEGQGVTRVVHASIAIGDAIEQEVKLHRLMQKSRRKKVYKFEEIEGEKDATKDDKLERKITKLMKENNLRKMRRIVIRQSEETWGHNIKARVGIRLIELLMQTAYIQPATEQASDDPPDLRPAFVHTVRRSGLKEAGKVCGFIQCDPLVLKGIERTVKHVMIPYMPMLVPPVNWTGYNKGAHFFLPSYVMRIHGAKEQREALKTAPWKQMKSVFEALDTLGNTRWRINKRILNAVERLWISGECVADLVDRNDVSLPDKPETQDETLLRKWKWEVRSVTKENAERYALRCDTEIKIEVARKMKDEEGFFYPHNLDFRGRAYPMHPYLSHLGSDMCRGVLEFAEGRPLGKSGLRWLKIHLANLYATGGVDKLSHEGRIAFTENHLDEIFDSADRPLEGKRWWLNAEDPFQLLAVCIELAGALRSTSPETFISHVHVHQDGSCNGLQHYAALGRDELGAAAVNLVAGDKPADVYTGIAGRVLEIMRNDAQKDPADFPDALSAKMLINEVDRKLVKQTVMTSVYGVTYIGARDQIKKRLKERGFIADDSELFRCSCYAAKVTLTSLGEMFEAARNIMSWLGNCAKIIASQNEPVRWTSPVGLPVVQPYRKLRDHCIRTSLQTLTLKRETENVAARMHKTAFPPNFVHSLDSSHMMMTAVACGKAGITFAGVHDSYWTHACDVDELNRILREKFVELYETPVLENLLESFQRSFPELTFPPLPERGEFDLKEVLASPYFFN